MEEKNTDKFLVPLSYDADLKETDDLKIYYQYLDEAFAEPRICNMAVSGSHGIGKSSILHSYDKKRQQRRDEEKKGVKKRILGMISRISILKNYIKVDEPHFLYVSLGKYINNTAEKDEEEKNIIERRILLQIYSRFHKRDIEAGRFDMIQEPSCFGRLNANLGGLLILMILLLIFYQPLGSLIKSVVGKSCLLLKWKTQIHIFLYMIVFAAVVVIGRHLIYYMLTQMHLKNIAVKSDNTEIDIERSACEDYLDLYATELIYCLEQIADKVDRTVVFEDMDRLNQKDCIEIFSRLREINYMLNQRLQGDKYVRFIYVIKDEVLNELQHAKFFDYILPIVSSINEKSSEDIFRQNLDKVNQRLQKRYKNLKIESIMFDAKEKKEESLVYIVAPYIRDYRLQYTILNDYSLLMELHCANNRNSLYVLAAEAILALAVYKNMWPKQYDRITSGKSGVVFDGNISENEELAEKLVNQRKQYLRYENFCYMGYSKEKLLSNIRKYILDAKTVDQQISRIHSFPDDEMYAEALADIVEEILPRKAEANDINESARLLEALIRFYLRTESFFLGLYLYDHEIRLYLKALSRLSDSDWKKYIKLTIEEYIGIVESDPFDAFEECLNIEFIAKITDWTEKEIEIFIYGTNNEEKYKGIKLHAIESDGKPMIVDLEKSIKQRKIQKVIPNTTA